MSDDALRGVHGGRNSKNSSITANNFVPMTSTQAPASVLARIFGDHAIYTQEEILQRSQQEGSLTMPSQGYYINQNTGLYTSYSQGQWNYNQGKASMADSSFGDCMFGESSLFSAAVTTTATTIATDINLVSWH